MENKIIADLNYFASLILFNLCFAEPELSDCKICIAIFKKSITNLLLFLDKAFQSQSRYILLLKNVVFEFAFVFGVVALFACLFVRLCACLSVWCLCQVGCLFVCSLVCLFVSLFLRSLVRCLVR